MCMREWVETYKMESWITCEELIYMNLEPPQSVKNI